MKATYLIYIFIKICIVCQTFTFFLNYDYHNKFWLSHVWACFHFWFEVFQWSFILCIRLNAWKQNAMLIYLKSSFSISSPKMVVPSFLRPKTTFTIPWTGVTCSHSERNEEEGASKHELAASPHQMLLPSMAMPSPHPQQFDTNYPTVNHQRCALFSCISYR